MANEWMRGTGDDALQGSTNASLIDDYVTAYLQDPLDRLLSRYRRGCRIDYASTTTVTVGIGEIVCSNSGDTIHKMRKNTSAITLSTAADLDTGSVAASSTYYVHAVADADATTFTGIISLSATAPTGVTYFKKLGSFKTDASVYITEPTVENDFDTRKMGGYETRVNDTVYQADTDGFVVAQRTGTGSYYIYADTFNPPTTVRQFSAFASGDDGGMVCVPRGYYWKALTTTALWWVPLF